MGMSNPQLIKLKSNQPLLLDDPQRVLIVQSGDVAVFAVKVNNGIPVGARRYLFSVKPGEALFGYPITGNLSASREQNRRLLAVTIAATHLLEVRGQELEGGDGETETEGDVANSDVLIKTWTEQLIGAVSGDFLSNKRFVSEIHTLAELMEFHRDFLMRLEEIERREAAEELQRFQEQKHLNEQFTEKALSQLTSVLQQSKADVFQEGTPLLIAADAVGKALGITIHPPVRSEDLKRLRDPVEAIARSSRIRIRRVLLTDSWWREDSGPLLGYTQGDRTPVALLPKSPTCYEIFDPITRTRTVVNQNNATVLFPEAYMFYRPFPDQMIRAWDAIQFAFFGRQRDLFALLFTGMIASLLGMMTPFATAILIDEAIPDANQGLLMQIVLCLFSASFGITIFQLAHGFVIVRLSTLSDTVTETAVWDRMLKLQVSFFRQYSTGDLQSRLFAIDDIRQQLSNTTLRSLFTSFFSLLNLGVLFFYSPQLALVALFVGLITILITITASTLVYPQLRQLIELQGQLFGLMVQLINGVAKLRVAAAEQRAFAFWAKKYRQELELILNTQKIKDWIQIFNTVIPSISSAIFFALSVSMIQENQLGVSYLSTGAFLGFYSAYGIFITGATTLSLMWIDLLKVRIQWERVQPILSAKLEIDERKADPGLLTGNLEIDHITFRYRSDGPLILDGVNLQATPGEFIAIVGPSGSGKSTIFRLLLGFETPELGSILYDGQELSSLDISAVRRQIGTVLQNGQINAGSIFENISCGALVTEDEVWEAAEMAGLADDILGLPMQLHTVISEGGTNFSGGQRQRLLIARALVLKPRILLFDEATSALDHHTQAIVSESLEEMKVTRIAIAHRLDTIRHADRIYVLAGGHVVQQGNFEQLVNQKGLFSQLIARQIAE